MKPFLLLCIIIVLHLSASAQGNPLLLPVQLVNGEVVGLISNDDDPAAIRKAGVRSISMFTVKQNPNGSDTFGRYTETFTQQGDKIPYHREYRDFDGFNSIGYNRDKTKAYEQWKEIRTLGCGTGGITVVYQEKRNQFQYQKRKLVLEVNSTKSEGGRWHDSLPLTGMHIAYGYNKKGLMSKQESYFLPDKPGGDTAKDVRRYRYNEKGKLSQIYGYESLYSPRAHIMDSMIDRAPPNFATVLLRQSPQWIDTIKAWAFAEPPNETDDAYEARMAALDFRDSADAEIMDFYESDKHEFSEFIGFDYDAKGRLISKLHFTNTDLTRKDSLAYDDKGHLVYWDFWHLAYDDDFQSWELENYNPLPLHARWIFTYDKKGRVATAALRHESSPEPHYSDWHYHFKPEKEVQYRLFYNDAGNVSRLDAAITKYNYGFDPDVIPPVSREQYSHYVNYDNW